ncbi:MAG: hypothetical protein EOP50_08965 [Sphingobacteriales bacterium]|nr:MAG: hypothetical protein EOP50_08965 [Sphingobacteriales bacterium]
MKNESNTGRPTNDGLKRPLFTGVALFAVLPQLLLIALLLYLFVVLFRTCARSSSGPVSKLALLGFLQQFQTRIKGRDALDPSTERRALEVLQNRVKVCNSVAQIRKDRVLRFQFIKSYNLVTEWPYQHRPDDPEAWKQLDLLMQEFYEEYLFRRHVSTLHPAETALR